MLDSSSYYLHLHAPILNPNVFPLIWPTHSNYRSFFLIFSLLDWSLVLKTFLSLYFVNIYDWFWLLLAYWTGSNPYFQRFEKRSSRSSWNNDLVEDIFQEFFTFWLIFGSENVLIFLFCELLRLISIAASLLNRPLPLVSTFWKKKQPFQQKERFGRWPFFKNFGPQNTFIFKNFIIDLCCGSFIFAWLSSPITCPPFPPSGSQLEGIWTPKESTEEWKGSR